LGSRLGVTVGLGALALVVLGAGGPAGAAGAPHPIRTVRTVISSTQTWTDTKVTLDEGQIVRVEATGFAHFGADPIAEVKPNGLAWGRECFKLAPTRADFPAPGLRCWSLIATVGNSEPQEVGALGTVKAKADGKLFLGVNDNYLNDNHGVWPVTISLYASPKQHFVATAPTTSQRSWLLPIALTLAVILAVIAAVRVGRRRWKTRKLRGPAFRHTTGMLVGQARVRVGPSGAVERVGRDGETTPFVPDRADFVDHMPGERRARFSWRGLNFMTVRSRIPFVPAHGEVQRVGQHAAGSKGVIKGRDGFTRARLPLSLDPAWVFTLDTAASTSGAQGSIEGDLTMLGSESRFDADVAKLSRSLPRVRDLAPFLRPETTNRSPQAARIG
jgi:hypothetical protein